MAYRGLVIALLFAWGCPLSPGPQGGAAVESAQLGAIEPTATPTMTVPQAFTQEFAAPAGIEDRCFAVYVKQPGSHVATYVGYTCEWDVGPPVKAGP